MPVGFLKHVLACKNIFNPTDSKSLGNLWFTGCWSNLSDRNGFHCNKAACRISSYGNFKIGKKSRCRQLMEMVNNFHKII